MIQAKYTDCLDKDSGCGDREMQIQDIVLGKADKTSLGAVCDDERMMIPRCLHLVTGEWKVGPFSEIGKNNSNYREVGRINLLFFLC